MIKLIRKNILLVLDSAGEKHLFNVPIGINVNKYSLKESNNEFIIIEHESKPDYDFSKSIKLTKLNHILKFEYNHESLYISLIYDNSDYMEAIDLLLKTHYMSNIPNGLYLTLKRNDEIIGVIVFSKLTYTVPVGRQIYFSGETIVKELKEELRDFSNHCIGWISRIVIKEKSKGYGEVFLNNLPKILDTIFPNENLEFIEVLTSISDEEIEKKLEPAGNINNEQLISFEHKKDFFSKAGYMNIKMPNKKIIGVRRNYEYKDDIRILKKIKIKKFYYMKELNIAKRLFVPLTKEAYDWFKNHNKQWEIRKLNCGQYNSKNIFEGHRVELRLGYKPGNSIWGEITAVKEFNDAEELINSIDFKLLIPSANNKNEAIERVNSYIGKDTKIITFKIDKDNV